VDFNFFEDAKGNRVEKIPARGSLGRKLTMENNGNLFAITRGINKFFFDLILG
jgi:hypothetical protein